jgi:hypothetical protein
MTTLVYEGCHAGYGEETPNEFVLPFATACEVAKAFLRTGEKLNTVEWFEL